MIDYATLKILGSSHTICPKSLRWEPACPLRNDRPVHERMPGLLGNGRRSWKAPDSRATKVQQDKNCKLPPVEQNIDPITKSSMHSLHHGHLHTVLLAHDILRPEGTCQGSSTAVETNFKLMLVAEFCSKSSIQAMTDPSTPSLCFPQANYTALLPTRDTNCPHHASSHCMIA
jgi:hypothetical protein